MFRKDIPTQQSVYSPATHLGRNMTLPSRCQRPCEYLIYALFIFIYVRRQWTTLLLWTADLPLSFVGRSFFRENVG